MLGGTQSLHTNGFDEALALPTEAAARLAVRTQQILAHETGVVEVVDPLAGSYRVEALTDRLEAEALGYLERIAGFNPVRPTLGMLRAIEEGFPQREIQEAAYAHQQAVDAGETVIVGVNRYTEEPAAARETALQRIDPAAESRQVERLRALRLRRGAATWTRALGGVREAARTGENLMPHLLTAVEAECTVGEITAALREVFGTYEEAAAL